MWASASYEPLSNASALGARAGCTMVTLPVIVLDPPGRVTVVCAGFTKPMNAWKPGAPNSTKKGGSPAFTQVSMTFVPSMVEVCVQSARARGRHGDDAVLAGGKVLDERRPAMPGWLQECRGR